MRVPCNVHGDWNKGGVTGSEVCWRHLSDGMCPWQPTRFNGALVVGNHRLWEVKCPKGAVSEPVFVLLLSLSATGYQMHYFAEFIGQALGSSLNGKPFTTGDFEE